ncbi:MAG TPA: lysophospholipid acyltransferase family protein [Candidatus Saccharimonadales bacterium]|nr:lysophospholipid acyltransferase family protein [Candidatus Saccharimonadales bacterium]
MAYSENWLLRKARRFLDQTEDPIMVPYIFKKYQNKAFYNQTFGRDIEVFNRHLFPDKGAVLVGPTHWHEEDGEMVLYSISPRPTYVMAKSELWTPEDENIGYLLQLMGAIRLERSGSPQIKAFRAAGKVLDAGGVVTVFPEGTRIEGPVRGEAHAGIGFLAVKHGVPIAPLGLARVSFNCPEDAIEDTVPVHTTVFGELVRPDPSLGFKDAVSDIMQRYTVVRDEVQQLAYEDAAHRAKEYEEIYADGWNIWGAAYE